MALSEAEILGRLREAVVALKETRAERDTLLAQKREPIAIIGMACRLPGADTPEKFFERLAEGHDAITEVPAGRWQVDRAIDAEPRMQGTRWGAFIDNEVDLFDAAFFGISPREAERLDPQQRLLLEVAWEALERAGQDIQALSGTKTGVFVGLMSTDYLFMNMSMPREQQDVYLVTGNGHCFAAGRLAYTFGFQGPALTIDTACSSSLVAVHAACQSLRTREADIALAAGVNLMLDPLISELTAKTGALAPDGRCKSLDSRANGYVRGEGCGVVVLKRLSDARRDGDPILALLRGSAVNQDGRSTGLTTPNVLAQESMLKQALENARLAPEDIGYVEMHGTGTPLGDPIEAEALRAVLGRPRADASKCALGALKTNIGHLEAAAGIAGLMKAILVLQRGLIPRNLHFRALNPRISFEGTPLVVPKENIPWERGSKARRAGVSAFGLSGTNAHVILEEAPVAEDAEPAKEKAYLLPLSAKSTAALDALAAKTAEWLSSGGVPPLRDISYTASARRTHYEHRMVVVGETPEELARELSASLRGEASGGTSRGRVGTRGAPKVVFVFPGQGSQWLGMGRQLLSEEPAFRSAIEQCDAAIRSEAGFSVLEELAADEAQSRLGSIDVVQPVLFAMQVGLAALWRSWGVEPARVVGHSMGEVAAAHVAGSLSLSDAVKIICRRSRLLRRISGRGAMAFVDLSMEDAERAIAGREGELGVAVSNGPRSTVISGEPGALEDVLGELEKRGVFCRRVKVDVASHSPQVEPLRDDLLRAIEDVRPVAGAVAMWSTVTGKVLTGDELVAAYWWDNLRNPVRFSEATRALLEEAQEIFLELSPHPVLLSSIEENLRAGGVDGRAIASMRRNAGGRRTMLEALGELYAKGVAIDWSKVHPGGGRVVPLPAYPWQRKRYWVEGTIARQASPPRDPLAECVYETVWQRTARASGARRPANAEGAWLLFVDRGGTGARLAAELRARGEHCVCVEAGAAYERLDAWTCRIDPMDPDHHRRLLEEYFSTSTQFRGVVHLSSLDSAPFEETTADTLARDLRCGALSAARLVRGLAGRASAGGLRMYFVTSGAQPAGGSISCVSPVQATVWGMARTLRLEHPEIDCITIDLGFEGGPDRAVELADELENRDGEDQVALRDDGRYVARLVEGRLEEAQDAAFRFRPDVSYLVTGGLGGLGLAMARWMVEQGARHVVLVGRRAPTDAAREQIRAMEQAGAEVLVLSADVSRREDVDAVMAAIDARLPPLRGIAHAAGVVGETNPIVELDQKSFESVTAPKILGSYHLHAATRERNLDFFVMYSSGSAVLGLGGKASYAAGNTFLDAMAHARWRQGLAATSIQWGGFTEVGLTASRFESTRTTIGGMGSMTTSEGLLALARLLAKPRAEVAVMRFSAAELIDLFPRLRGSRFLSILAPNASTGSGSGSSATASALFLDRIGAASPANRRALLDEHVRQLLGQVLRLAPEQIEGNAAFHALGMDSLMSLELRNRIEASLGLKLPVSEIWARGSVDALVGLLEERLSTTLAALEAPLPAAPPQTSAPATVASGRWIVVPRPVPDAKMRLFCFPYAGGGAPVFAGWPDEVPDSVELCIVQPPGRHERQREPVCETMEEMVAALLPELLRYIDRPFAVFGHCLGAIAMFETLRELTTKHGLRPVQVFVSGAPAPRQYLLPAFTSQSDEEFVELLRFIGLAHDDVLDDEDARREILPTVKADFELGVRYRYQPGPPLDAPIMAFSGREDEFAPPNVLEAWRELTTVEFSQVVFAGQHYFIIPERSALLRIIGEELIRHVALADQRHRTSIADAITTSAGWVRVPARSSGRGMRLFCFPGVGFDGSVYERWSDSLGAAIDVCPILLPGRGARARELPLARVEDIVELVVPALAPFLNEPFSFFGIDVGSILAFETARRLRREGRPLPRHVFVGPAMAPQTYYLAPLHQLSEKRLVQTLQRLGIPVVPEREDARELRAECAAMSNYRYVVEEPFDVPFTAFMGDRDTLVPPGAIQAWEQQTTIPMGLHVIAANHDMVRSAAPELLRVLRSTVGE